MFNALIVLVTTAAPSLVVILYFCSDTTMVK